MSDNCSDKIYGHVELNFLSTFYYFLIFINMRKYGIKKF